MTVNAKVSVFDLVEAANEVIDTVPVGEAVAMHGAPDVVFVDLRDVRELEREGRIPGAFHMPRGMVEFWVDPASPYFKSDVFGPDRRFAFYCNKDWRSALATEVAQRIGLERVCHIEGGYTAWKGSRRSHGSLRAQARVVRRTRGSERGGTWSQLRASRCRM